MSNEIVIIPISIIHECNAYNILNKLKDCVKNTFDIQIDINYSSPLTSRVGKYRKQNKDIIKIDDDYNETNSIIIHFAGKGNKPTSMPIQELIELISTLENDSDDEKSLNKDKISKSEPTKSEENLETNESTCIIM